jgi:hypothetical protein
MEKHRFVRDPDEPFSKWSPPVKRQKANNLFTVDVLEYAHGLGGRENAQPSLNCILQFISCLHRGSLSESTATWQACLSINAFRRRLENVERENLNPSAGLRASHEWMGDVSIIPEAGRQNPEGDKTPSSSASQDSPQPDELEGVMSLETALVRTLQRLGAIW